MIVHFEALDGLVVLNDGIEGLLLQLLPVPAQVVLGVRVEQEQEVLNVRYDLFKFEVVPCRVKLEGFFL